MSRGPAPMGRGHHINASKQPDPRLEVRDDQLGRVRRATCRDSIFQHHFFKPEGREDLADLWAVVDRQDELAADPGQLIGHRLEVITLEHALTVVALPAPVRRIEVEQGLRPIIAGDQIGPIQVFEDDAFQPLVRGLQDRLQPGQAEAGRAISRNTEDAAGLATEGLPLKVEEPGRALEVGQG